jgi:hypothetical protein
MAKQTLKQSQAMPPPPAIDDPHPAPNGVDEDAISIPGAQDDPDEFARYAVTDVVTSQSGEAAFCYIGPPNKLHFFRAHHDTSLYRVLHFLTIEEENRKRNYLVRGDLVALPEFEGRTSVRRTSPWVNEFGAIGLWLVSIQSDDNSWVRSALNAIERAKSEWICAVPVKKAGQYTLVPSKRDRGEPKWPDLNFSGWMKLAFPDDMRIDSADHPIARHLRGE